MSQSVSFILPVRDLQYLLRDRVQLILEVLSELTTEFDVLLVDYGSRDDTREVALDLMREYPQVDYLERGEGTDLLAAVEAGIFQTRGEIIFVHDPALPLGVAALQRLWQMRNDTDLVMAQSRSQDGSAPALLGRRGPRALNDASGSVQMIRRVAIPRTSRPADASVAVARVTRTDLMGESPEATRLPKLLSRLRRIAANR